MAEGVLYDFHDFDYLSLDQEFLTNLGTRKNVLPNDILGVDLLQDDNCFGLVLCYCDIYHIISRFDKVTDGEVYEVVIVADEPLSRRVLHLCHFFKVDEALI